MGEFAQCILPTSQVFCIQTVIPFLSIPELYWQSVLTCFKQCLTCSQLLHNELNATEGYVSSVGNVNGSFSWCSKGTIILSLFVCNGYIIIIYNPLYNS